jgi:hypothetical protein
MSAPDHEAREGVIRFRYRLLPARGAPPLEPLRSAHARGLAQGWLGRDPHRYDGLAYGNLSLRAGDGFWVTASQRTDQPVLEPDDLVEISGVDEDWAVTAHGERPPSSETLTHAAVHRAAPSGPLAVFHGHAPELWVAQGQLGWSTTPTGAANGTHALADAVGARVAATPTAGALAMLGHEDGILLWAPDFEAIFATLDAALRRLATGRRDIP